jgi:hypothetical protein
LDEGPEWDVEVESMSLAVVEELLLDGNPSLMGCAATLMDDILGSTLIVPKSQERTTLSICRQLGRVEVTVSEVTWSLRVYRSSVNDSAG